jgi:hypothetical protein
VVEQGQDGQKVEEGAKEGAEGSDDPENENVVVILVLDVLLVLVVLDVLVVLEVLVV